MAGPRLAKDIMVTRLATVTTETDLRDGAALLLRRGITGAPVVDAEHRYLGMLSEIPCMQALTEIVRSQTGREAVSADQIMAKKLVTLRSDMDAFDAINILLKRRISGAPVIDAKGDYLGVFSERYCMNLLIQSAYEHWPATQVGGYMNTDRDRLIHEGVKLLDLAQLFLDSYFRRLPVLRQGKPVGQVSRRDVLRAELASIQNPTGVRVGDAMEKEALTITEDRDLLSIAQVFQSTNSRRLPVLRNGILVGQISRRDLLLEAQRLIEVSPQPERALLYLSATMAAGESPHFR